MKSPPAVSVPDNRRRRSGMTLIEVIIGIAVLAVMAVLAASALYYPRYLVVTSALEQNAIHAGSAAIEGTLHNYSNPQTNTAFKLDNWNIGGDITSYPPTPYEDTIPGTGGDKCKYLIISNSVSYRGKTVKFVTYRSLELINSQREAK